MKNENRLIDIPLKTVVQVTALLLSIMFVSIFLTYIIPGGEFENMLTLLPIVASLCVLLGYDSYTGFLCCIASTAIGFATAITNPFTVVLASNIIGISPVAKIWYRLIIFAVIFLIMIGYIFFYIRRIEKDPRASLTYESDAKLRESSEKTVFEDVNEARVRNVYTVFLILAIGISIGY